MNSTEEKKKPSRRMRQTLLGQRPRKKAAEGRQPRIEEKTRGTAVRNFPDDKTRARIEGGSLQKARPNIKKILSSETKTCNGSGHSNQEGGKRKKISKRTETGKNMKGEDITVYETLGNTEGQ